MPKTCWSLRKRILLSMLVIFVLLSLSGILTTRTIFFEVLKTEFKHRSLNSARNIAFNSVIDILTQNKTRLKRFLESEKNLDKDAQYIFIMDSSGQILAHTFKGGFPVDLAKANELRKGEPFSIRMLDTGLGFIYDIAVPVVSEKRLLGQVHLGVMRSSVQDIINRINFVSINISVLIMALGVLLIYKVVSLITKPIEELSEATQAIKSGNFSTRILVRSKDEVGQLAAAFNEMSSDLNRMIEETKRLTMIEERSRIVFGLHDGRAQDLADIIKRIELCEKLFKIEPEKAFQELNILKENTREVLAKTRKVIFDLKSAEDNNFELLGRLSVFLKDFEKKNDIMITFDAPDKLDMPLERQRAVFSIIAEVFANIRKHAQAKKAALSLRLEENNILQVNIKDYGMGFDVGKELQSAESDKLGLISIRQRAASLGGAAVIESIPGEGTMITITVPLTQQNEKG